MRKGQRRRAEAKIIRLQTQIRLSKRWLKMMEKVDIGKPAPTRLPVVRPAEITAKTGRSLACAGPRMRIQTRYFQTTTAKDLKKTVTHEMVHYYLSDNGVIEVHGPLFKACCDALGLRSPWRKEAVWKYKHICPCGWWLKSMRRKRTIYCGSCRKLMILPSVYDRRKAPFLNVDDVVPMTVERA